jgi:hypothetical protein
MKHLLRWPSVPDEASQITKVKARSAILKAEAGNGILRLARRRSLLLVQLCPPRSPRLPSRIMVAGRGGRLRRIWGMRLGRVEQTNECPSCGWTGNLRPPHRPARLTACSSARALTQREPHWNVTVLVPSELVTRLDVIACEPDFRQ